MNLVYKLLTQDEWKLFENHGVFDGSDADIRDGFIHLSHADQVPGTAQKHFAGRGALVLLALDAHALGEALRDEISRGGALFPHLYRALQRTDMAWHRPIGLSEEGVPVIPDLASPELARVPFHERTESKKC